MDNDDNDDDAGGDDDDDYDDNGDGESVTESLNMITPSLQLPAQRVLLSPFIGKVAYRPTQI